MKERLIVYCDGSCRDNGSDHAIGGIGIWFGKDDQRNVSELLEEKQTIHTVKLMSIERVLDIVADPYIDLEIRSDSLYSVNVLTGKCKVIKNVHLIQRIRGKIDNRNLSLTYIKRNSKIGNRQANKLSMESINYCHQSIKQTKPRDNHLITDYFPKINRKSLEKKHK